MIYVCARCGVRLTSRILAKNHRCSLTVGTDDGVDLDVVIDLTTGETTYSGAGGTFDGGGSSTDWQE